MGTMTIDQLLAAINAAGLTPERITRILVSSDMFLNREELRSKEAAIRAEATKAQQAYEAAIQAAHAEFLAADEATQPK